MGFSGALRITKVAFRGWSDDVYLFAPRTDIKLND